MFILRFPVESRLVQTLVSCDCKQIVWPWKTTGLNLVDAATNIWLIAIVLASMPFANETDPVTKEMATQAIFVGYV